MNEQERELDFQVAELQAENKRLREEVDALKKELALTRMVRNAEDLGLYNGVFNNAP